MRSKKFGRPRKFKQENDMPNENEEKEKRANELIIAKKKIAYESEEKEKCETELIIANKKLAYENEEKEKRANELIIANKKLGYENKEKKKRADELIIANKKLFYENEEKEKRVAELANQVQANIIIDKRLRIQNKKISEIAFLQSHQVRKPVANLLGLISLFNFNNPNDPLNSEVLLRLKIATNELDNIIAVIVKKTDEIKE